MNEELAKQLGTIKNGQIEFFLLGIVSGLLVQALQASVTESVSASTATAAK